VQDTSAFLYLGYPDETNTKKDHKKHKKVKEERCDLGGLILLLLSVVKK